LLTLYYKILQKHKSFVALNYMSHFIPIACLILLKKIDVDINFML